MERMEIVFDYIEASVPLFSHSFVIIKILCAYCISRSYLPGVATDERQLYLSNMNVIERLTIWKRYNLLNQICG